MRNGFVPSCHACKWQLIVSVRRQIGGGGGCIFIPAQRDRSCFASAQCLPLHSLKRRAASLPLRLSLTICAECVGEEMNVMFLCRCVCMLCVSKGVLFLLKLCRLHRRLSFCLIRTLRVDMLLRAHCPAGCTQLHRWLLLASAHWKLTSCCFTLFLLHLCLDILHLWAKCHNKKKKQSICLTSSWMLQIYLNISKQKSLICL